MKLHYFSMSILLCIALTMMCSCLKTNEPEEIVFDTTTTPTTYEGCEVKNPELTTCKGALKGDHIYLYGSRRNKSNESGKLWIAQYNLQHELLKEYSETVDGLPLYAIKMMPLKNGKFIIICNKGDAQDTPFWENITEQLPAILDPTKKELKVTRIGNGFYFDVVNEYDDFLLLNPSDKAIILNTNIDPNNYLKAQISYEGEVFFKSHQMRIPTKDASTLWINRNEYIVAKKAAVVSTFLDASKKDRWKKDVDIAEASSIEIATIGSDIKVEYKYEENDRKRNKTYHFDFISGEQRVIAKEVSTAIKSNETTLTANKELDLKASILPVNAFLKGIKYETSDATIVTVNEKGIIKTLKNGNCVIYVSSEDGFAEQAIELTVSSLSFAQKSYQVMIDQSKLLDIIADQSISINDLIWKSSNESIASVNEKGKVTGLQKGETTITATTKDGILKTSCTLEVKCFMDFVKINQSMTYIGSNLSGTMWMSIGIFNQNDDDAEIVSISLCYEKNELVIVLIQNQLLASKTGKDISINKMTIYPVNEPYLKFMIKHKDKVYETQQRISIK